MGERLSTVDLRPLAAVAVGGALGSSIRWGALELAATTDPFAVDPAIDSVELTTWIINVVGSLLLGVLLSHRRSLTANGFLGMGTGFAGGLTTFSTFAVAVAQRLDDGDLVAALTNGIGTGTAALLAAGIGYRLGMVTRR